MSRLLPRLLQILCLILAAASLAVAADLGQLQQSFMKRYDEANATRDESLKKLETSYLGALKRHMDKVKVSGRLELVVPVRDEIEAVEGRVDPLPVLPENTSYDLKQLRKKYETARRKVVTDHAEAILDLAEKMTDALQKQEAELTKAGKIDEALAAKRMRETLGQGAGIQAARERLQAVKRAGKALPALRIRRCGDDLEVIVYYDRNGKVSMDSPVENVRESGEKQGDTSARVLGEFVGAEGYEVDSWVAYSQVFDGGQVEGLKASGFDLKPAASHAGEKALRIRVDRDAKSPYANLGHVLPPMSEIGTFRLRVSYYIPDKNQILKGLSFAQGGGGPIQGARFEHAGKWRSDEVTAQSSGTKPNLFLFVPQGAPPREGRGGSDFVLLKKVEVEHISFSAFIVECHDRSSGFAAGDRLTLAGELAKP